jgi:hypothetical protein
MNNSSTKGDPLTAKESRFRVPSIVRKRLIQLFAASFPSEINRLDGKESKNATNGQIAHYV